DDAKRMEEMPRAVKYLGPLHGIPVGIKDIIQTAGVEMSAGSRILAGFVPTEDAEVVRRLRLAGAVILGKTATTQFALFDPAPTRNPHNLAHTPGGSSSGSAAAVAAHHCFAAIGSQTLGSILRPAAYCGVAGLKPTYDLVSRKGVLPLAWSMDHVGPIARTSGDLLAVWNAIRRPDKQIREAKGLPYIVGVPDRFFFEKTDPAMVQAFRAAVGRLENAGAAVREVRLPSLFEAGVEAGYVRMATAPSFGQSSNQDCGSRLCRMCARSRFGGRPPSRYVSCGRGSTCLRRPQPWARLRKDWGRPAIRSSRPPSRSSVFPALRCPRAGAQPVCRSVCSWPPITFMTPGFWNSAQCSMRRSPRDRPSIFPPPGTARPPLRPVPSRKRNRMKDRIEQKPLTDSVFEKLRSEILHGKLKPGELLRQEEITERFGVSRTPVREAIQRLQMEGLVTLYPRRKAVVSTVPVRKISEIYDIRARLEAFAAELAVGRLTDKQLHRLADLIREMEALDPKSELEKILDKNREFHYIIYSAAENETLVAMINQLWRDILR